MKMAGAMALLLTLLFALFLFWFVLRLARRRALAMPPGPAPQADAGALAAAAALVPAVRAAFSGREEEGGLAYDVPLVLLLSEPGADQSLVLPDALPEAGERTAQEAQPLRWHRTPQGWILAADAAYLGLDVPEGSAAWQALAEELQRRRPRRPLDGILLSIAADALQGEHAWPAVELERRAGLIQRRLDHMQRLFGLRLPVFLVITHADRLDGYTSFASALPEGMRQAMLGWSVPDAPDTGFQPEWIHAGFEELSRSICALQAEMLAAGTRISDSDAFFMLPGSVAALAVPLHSYIARLLRDSAHDVAPLFRGVYLCGGPGVGAHGLPSRPWFAGDLLARKVFGERGLAQPLGGQLLSRNKLVRRWALASAAVLLLWGGALAWAHVDLRGKTRALGHTLAEIDQEQKQRILGRSQNAGHLDYASYKQAAQNIMSAMADNRGNLSYLALPASWHWGRERPLEERIEAKFGEGLTNIVYRTLDKGLNRQAASLSGAASDGITTSLNDPVGCVVPPLSALDDVIEADAALADNALFKRLANFVAETEEFAQARKRLNLLEDDDLGTYDDLVKVAAYTDSFEMPTQSAHGVSALLKRTLRHANLPEDALKQRARQQESLACAFRKRSTQFYERSLNQHPLLALATDIGERLRGGKTQDGDGKYRQLIPSLQSAALWLKSPSLRWLDETESGAGKAYGALLASVSTNAMLGQELAQWSRTERARHAAALQAALLAADGGAGDPILQIGAEGKLEFTPELANLKSGLDRLMRQSFLASAPPPALLPGPAPGPLWESKALEQNVAMATEARAYLAKELGTFPLQFQAELKRYAGLRVADKLLTNAVLAQQTSGNEAEVYAHLGQAHKPLVALLDNLDALGAARQHAQLSAVLAAQAGGGLRWIERELAKGGLYQPREGNFGWWQGTPNPAAQGFAGGDPQALEEYLQAQQARIEAAVAQAQPLLRLLEAGEGGASSPLARRWIGLTAELARFHEKQPNARMAQLHAYIRGELATADGKNCLAGAAMPAIAANFTGGEFFTERRRALTSALSMRCRELARSGAGQQSQDLQELFQHTLAGRFPFADAASSGDPAELEDVQAYLQRYDLAGLDSQRLAPGRTRDFLAATARVRSFLAPLLPGADNGAGPGYELAVRFRVSSSGEADGNNTLAGEIGGNRIAAWTLQSGDARIGWSSSSKGVVQSLPWRPGMPLVLTLRWADNVAALPYSDGRDRYMSVNGRDVVFRYSEPWSLLRMLARQRVAPGAPVRYETLGFDIPLALAGTASASARGGTPAADERARVFLRMAVTPAQKKETLAYPPFPVAAPPAEQAILIARP